MASSFIDRCFFNSTTAGTGSFTVGTAVLGFMTPSQAGAVDGATYSYAAQLPDMSQWEIGVGVYSASAGTLTRTPLKSSNANAAVTFTSNPQVTITLLAEDLNALGAWVNPRAANLVLAGPSSGSAVAPTFRSLVAADLPADNRGTVTSATSSLITGVGPSASALVATTLTAGTYLVLCRVEVTASTANTAANDYVASVFSTTNGQNYAAGNTTNIQAVSGLRLSGAASLADLILFGVASPASSTTYYLNAQTGINGNSGTSSCLGFITAIRLSR